MTRALTTQTNKPAAVAAAAFVCARGPWLVGGSFGTSSINRPDAVSTRQQRHYGSEDQAAPGEGSA
jgi:hypothetical protein